MFSSGLDGDPRFSATDANALGHECVRLPKGHTAHSAEGGFSSGFKAVEQGCENHEATILTSSLE